LERRGFAVAVVPEVATLMMENGFNPRAAKNDIMLGHYEGQINRVQRALEDGMLESLLLDYRPGVLLCDRGIPDNAAYVPPSVWRALAREAGGQDALFRRYDAVFHLVSTAWDKPEAYQTTQVRIEDVDAARQLEQRTRLAWDGHPMRQLIGNRGGFDLKLQDLFTEVARILGVLL
jgi:hypothetical protein